MLSRYVDAIMIRTFDQDDVDELARHGSIPVINGLTDVSHPCQALADVMTIRERLGRIEGVRVAYLGDGNNVCASLMVACAKLGMRVRRRDAGGLRVRPEAVELAREAGGEVELTNDPRKAANGADVLYTDVWTSMGQEEERERRLRDLHGFGIDAELVGLADRRRDRPALPPGPLRRGDHRGRALRPALGGLGRGREPPARAEGACSRS